MMDARLAQKVELRPSCPGGSRSLDTETPRAIAIPPFYAPLNSSFIIKERAVANQV